MKTVKREARNVNLSDDEWRAMERVAMREGIGSRSAWLRAYLYNNKRFKEELRVLAAQRKTA